MEGPVPHLDFDFVVPSRYQLEPSNRPPLHQNATERALTPLDLTSSTSTLSVMGPLPILNTSSEKLHLTSLNLDVLDHIMTLLSDEALVALRATCLFFADAAVRPLSRRSYRGFRTHKSLASFIRFLRLETTHSRAQLIRELHFPEELRYDTREADFISLFRGVLRIVEACQQLRCLHIDLELTSVSDLFQDLSWSIATMPNLRDLRIKPPYPAVNEGPAGLFRPRLRRLTLPIHYPIGNFPPGLLPATLEELDLSAATSTWTLPPKPSFPSVRRLRIPYADNPLLLLMGELLQAFPGLRHLSITGELVETERLGTSSSRLLYSISNARAELERYWNANPTSWPKNLVSITVDDPSYLYALAVPIKVRHCLIQTHTNTYCNYVTTTPILPAIFDDVQPSSAQCHFVLDNRDTYISRDDFRFLSTAKSLVRCLVIFDYRNNNTDHEAAVVRTFVHYSVVEDT
ncbi:hypothetical protein C8Q70DRAFT_654884 [Cubamyces menziesii]|nr:hypothetical protein C8Q70DRAFT_654884 [Cubamyces menziesii]